MKFIAIMITVSLMVVQALADCADTVAQSKSNGVWEHLMKLTDNKTELILQKKDDEETVVEISLEGEKFTVLEMEVNVCTNGENSIKVSAGAISGTVTKTTVDGKVAYEVEAPGGYSGTYIVIEGECGGDGDGDGDGDFRAEEEEECGGDGDGDGDGDAPSNREFIKVVRKPSFFSDLNRAVRSLLGD